MSRTALSSDAARTMKAEELGLLLEGPGMESDWIEAPLPEVSDFQ